MDRAKIFACLIAAAALAGCGRREVRVVVGSKNFTEQVVLGEIIAQHLERRLQTGVDRKLNLGGTLLSHAALEAGQIDLYPEYTGTALIAILKRPLEHAPEIVRERVRQEYEARRLVWMPPLGFDNSFAMVVRADDARARKLESLSDAARSSTGWQLGVGYEFLTRPDGYPALMKAYNLPMRGAAKSMDLGLVYPALAQQQVDMVAGNTTDGLLSVSNTKVLRDDRHAFPPYEAAIVVRADSLDREPKLGPALRELSGKFNEETMRKLNHAVDGEHRAVTVVAREFLERAGLAK